MSGAICKLLSLLFCSGETNDQRSTGGAVCSVSQFLQPWQYIASDVAGSVAVIAKVGDFLGSSGTSIRLSAICFDFFAGFSGTQHL